MKNGWSNTHFLVPTLAKLNVFDRTQAAIIAIQHDLDKDWSLKPNLLALPNPFAPKHRQGLVVVERAE